MSKSQVRVIQDKFPNLLVNKSVISLDISDDYAYRDADLIKRIKEKYENITSGH